VHGRLEALGALEALGTSAALQALGTTSPEVAQSVPKTVTASDAAVDDSLSSTLYLPDVLDRNQVPLAVSLYVYMHASVCVHACLSMCTCMSLYVYMHVSLCVHACLSMCTCMFLYVYMHVSLCVHACLSLCEACIHTCGAICARASVFGLCSGCVPVKNVHVRLH